MNIDWGALGIVLWRFAMFWLTIAAMIAGVVLALTYLGAYALLIIPGIVIFAYLKFEYQHEVLKRGGYRPSTWDSDR